MALPTFYNVGTVSVANGSVTVTGVNTIWGRDAIMLGDLFCDLAQPMVPPQRIASVASDGLSLTLAAPWPGTTMTTAAYEIRYVGITERSTAQSRRVMEQLSAVEANGRGVFYRYSALTADSDPGPGYLRLNNAVEGSATIAYIDALDANGSDLLAFIDTWDDSSSTIKGKLVLRSVATPSKVAIYNIGAVTTATGYRKVALTFVDGDADFVQDEGIMVDVSRTGDKTTYNAFIESLLDDIDSAAFQTTLGFSTFIKTFLAAAGKGTARSTLMDGAWETISAVSIPSAVAQVDFTNLGAYRCLRANFKTRPATDGAVLMARVSADNGVSFNSTSGAYTIQRILAASTTLTAISSNAQTGFNLRSGGNTTDEGQAGMLTLYNFGPTGMVFAVLQVMTLDTGVFELWMGAAQYIGTSTLDALRFVMSTGNIAEGFIMLEGIK